MARRRPASGRCVVAGSPESPPHDHLAVGSGAWAFRVVATVPVGRRSTGGRTDAPVAGGRPLSGNLSYPGGWCTRDAGGRLSTRAHRTQVRPFHTGHPVLSQTGSERLLRVILVEAEKDIRPRLAGASRAWLRWHPAARTWPPRQGTAPCAEPAVAQPDRPGRSTLATGRRPSAEIAGLFMAGASTFHCGPHLEGFGTRPAVSRLAAGLAGRRGSLPVAPVWCASTGRVLRDCGVGPAAGAGCLPPGVVGVGQPWGSWSGAAWS